MRTLLLFALVLVHAGCVGRNAECHQAPDTPGQEIKVAVLAGNGAEGSTNGSGGPQGAAEFGTPIGVASDGQGNVYVADETNNCVRQIDSSGEVTTLAGTGGHGYVDGSSSVAQISQPSAVAVDGAGNVLVTSIEWGGGGGRLRKITSDGDVTTIAGNGACANTDGTGGAQGTASFCEPHGIAVDGQGNIFVADTGNGLVRMVDPAGNVTSVFENPAFPAPWAIAVDSQGTLYVGQNDSLYTIASGGQVTLLAGNPDTVSGYEDGLGTAAAFDALEGITLDSSGTVYLADSGNGRIRRVDATGNVTTLAGDGSSAFAAGTGGCGGDAAFVPTGVAAGASGVVYVADPTNMRILSISF